MQLLWKVCSVYIVRIYVYENCAIYNYIYMRAVAERDAATNENENC